MSLNEAVSVLNGAVEKRKAEFKAANFEFEAVDLPFFWKSVKFMLQEDMIERWAEFRDGYNHGRQGADQNKGVESDENQI